MSDPLAWAAEEGRTAARFRKPRANPYRAMSGHGRLGEACAQMWDQSYDHETALIAKYRSPTKEAGRSQDAR